MPGQTLQNQTIPVAQDKKTKSSERKELHFLEHTQLELFTAARFHQIYGATERIPPHVSTIYLALMKCFDQAIANHERRGQVRPSR